MSINPYEDMLQGNQNTGVNPYDNVAKTMAESQAQQTGASIVVAAQGNPDRAAEVLSLSKKTNLPTSVVERNFDKVKASNLVSENNYERIVQRNPKLASWLQNPDNSAVAIDDISNLKSMERVAEDDSFFEDVAKSASASVLSTLSGSIKFSALLDQAQQDAVPAGVNLDQVDPVGQFEKQEAAKVNPLLYKNPATEFLDAEAAKLQPKDLGISIVTEAMNGNFGIAGRAAAMQIAATAPQLALLAVSPKLALSLMFTSSAGNKLAENLEKGVKPDMAKFNALSTAGIETGVESLGGIGSSPFKAMMKDLTTAVGKQASVEIIKDGLVQLAKGSLEEGAEEWITSIANDLVDYGTDVNPEALKDIGIRAADSFVVGAGAGAAVMTPAQAVNMSAQVRNRNRAETTKESYTRMGDLIKESKLMKRSPEAQESYLAEATKGTTMENVYISSEAFETYFQKSGESPAKAAETLGIAEQYNQAKESGADIVVPMSKWATSFVETDHYKGLSNDVKFSPEAPSINEAKVDEDALVTIDQNAAAAVKEEVQQEQQIKAVTDNLVTQLIATGQKRSEAVKNAQILTAGLTTFAKESGQSVTDLFAKYGLKINAASDEQVSMDAAAQTTLNQKDPRIQRAESMGFDTSKTLFHGTNKTFDSFSNKNLGKSGRSHGQVYFFSDNSEVANQFAEHSATQDFITNGIPFDWNGDADLYKEFNNINEKIRKEKNQEQKEELQKQADAIDRKRYDNRYSGQQVLPVYLKTENPLIYDANGKYLDEKKINRIINQAKQDGHDSVVFNNIVDNPDDGEIVSNVTAVFKPNQIRSVNAKFEDAQSEMLLSQDIKGQIRFGKDRKFNIDLFSQADQSTFMHESAHFLFEVMGDLAQSEKSSQRLKDDYQALLKWTGVESRDQIKTEQHEKVARAFEAYLMEGKAPTKALRKAFNTFKVWLTDIYNNVLNLDVELNPEIRGIFDRILATDEQINQAEALQNYQPMFDPADVGMNDEQTAKYLEAMNEARLESEEIIRQELMNDLVQQQKAEYKELKEKVNQEVSNELDQLPVYKTLSLLSTGKMPDGSEFQGGLENPKLDRKLVQSMYGDLAKSLPGKIFGENAVDPEYLSDLMGFESADVMIEELANMGPKKEVQAAEVDRRMKERYPDLLTSPRLPEAAVKAVHNDSRERMLRYELEYLSNYQKGVLNDAIRRVIRRVPTKENVRKQADSIIASKKIQEIRPIVYQRAEIKAAKEAARLFAKGDIEGAFKQKKNELLNHELYRSAINAKEQVAKDVKMFKKLFKSDADIAKTRDVDMVNAARAILAEFGITRADKTAAQYLEPIKTYDPDQYNHMMTLVNAATQGEVANYKDISFDDFTAMSDSVKAMWDLARTSRQMEIDGEKFEIDQVVSDLNARIDEMAGSKAMPGYKETISDGEKRSMGLLGIKARLRRVEHWAYAMDMGALNGVFKKFIVRPVIDAQTRNDLKKVEVHKQLAEIAKNLDGDQTHIYAKEIDYNFKGGKPELLAAISHSGNNSNLEKLLLGRQWGVKNSDGSLDRSAWDAMITRMQREGILTKKDYDFVQSIWDLNDTLKGDAQKAHKQMYGHYFNEVTANEFQTPWGNYRGGYMPAIVDQYMNQDAKRREDQAALEGMDNSFMFPTTGRGFTKSRVDQYHAPLLLDLNRLPSHLDKVVRFSILEPAIKNAAKLISNESFSRNMARVDAAVVSEMLTPWLQRTALQTVQKPSQGFGGKQMDAIFNGLRTKSSLQVMAFNVANMVQNFTGAFPVMVKVKPQHLLGAFSDYIKGSAVLSESIQEKSAYMTSRIGENARDISRDYKEKVMQPTKTDKVNEVAKEFAYFGEKATNGLIEQVAWSGAYRQAVEQGMTEKEAVSFADDTVRMNLFDPSPSGVAAVETGTAFQRLFLMFYGFFNNQGNLLASEIAIARQLGLSSKEGSKKAAIAYSMIVMAPAILSNFIGRVMAGEGLDADDDDEYIDDVMDIMFLSQFKFLMAMVPGGTIANTALNNLNDKPYDDKINVSPVVSSLESAIRAPVDVYKATAGNGPSSKAIKSTATAIGLMTGLPTNMAARPLSYLADVKEGKATPDGPVDFARGLATGKRGN